MGDLVVQIIVAIDWRLRLTSAGTRSNVIHFRVDKLNDICQRFQFTAAAAVAGGGDGSDGDVCGVVDRIEFLRWQFSDATAEEVQPM